MWIRAHLRRSDLCACHNSGSPSQGECDSPRRLAFSSGTNYRFKFGVKFPFVEAYRAFPSVTVVNGPFGDFVNYGDDAPMYFSYYSKSLIGMTTDRGEMARWEAYANNSLPVDVARYQVAAHEAGLVHYFPGALPRIDRPTVGGGYILGNGATPITDPHSQLHSRADYPFAVDDGYVSVSTQKFTMAPENAYRLEKMLFGDPS